jgi:uncharacterized membrane protein YoaK (UPF0700 family)
MNSDIHPPDKWLTFGFALIGGYGDAAGFVLAKTFAGHVTGSLVLAAITVVARDWRGTFAHFLAVVSFLSGIPLSALLTRLSTVRPSWPTLNSVMVIEVILIVAGYLALAFHAPAAVEILVICLSLALGLQNGAFRHTGGISVHTTYLTGTITGLIATKTEQLAFRGTSGPPAALDPKFGLLCGVWAVFVLGAAIGAATAFHFRERGILGAALILFAIIVRNFRVVLRASPGT